MRQGLFRALGVCLLTSGALWGAPPARTGILQPRPLPAAQIARTVNTPSADGWSMASDNGEIGLAMASDAPTPAAGSGVSIGSEAQGAPPAYSDGTEYIQDDGYVYQGDMGCASADGSCYAGDCDSNGAGYCGGSLLGLGRFGLGCGGCGPCDNRNWAQVDYLYWWEKGSNLPALVTTASTQTPVSSAGVLTQDFRNSSTGSILVGRQDLENGPQSGGRVKFGRWLDDCQRYMVGGEFFMLQTKEGRFDGNTDQYPVLARPFLNAANNLAPTAVIIGYPNLATGQISVKTETDVTGGGAFLRHGLTGFRDARLDLLWGYRFLRMDDLVRVDDFTTVTGVGTGRPVAVGSTIQCFDSFDTKNEFHGGEVGLLLDVPVSQRLRVSMLGKCAFGPVEQLVNIRGGTIATAGQSVGNFVGSVLTQETNIGLYRQRELAVLPEAQANVTMQITQHISGVIGYTFVYLSSVQRAADAIDTTVHEDLFTDTPVANAGGPNFAFRDSDFWLQGINFGVDVRF